MQNYTTSYNVKLQCPYVKLQCPNQFLISFQIIAQLHNTQCLFLSSIVRILLVHLKIPAFKYFSKTYLYILKNYKNKKIKRSISNNNY